MKEMTKQDKNSIKSMQRNLNKMVSFEAWSQNIKPSIQEYIKNSNSTPQEFYNNIRQDYLELIKRIEEKYN